MAGKEGEVNPAFPCIQCGLCCRHVHLAEQTRHLDRGDGTCGHYDDGSRSCSIYAARPDVCRVDRQYELHHASLHSWGDFVEANLAVCRTLQEREERTAVRN